MSVSPISGGARPRLRRSTATARFGSSRRESHDASGFYARFVAPDQSPDTTVVAPPKTDVIVAGDARRMQIVRDKSVALVVTSPPYFAGKEYEESLGRNGVPATYLDYLDLLRDVFRECTRVLEPGGRIAVNVANLGRRPYRSLSGDVTGILQDLGLLLRGEVVWWKGRAAGGSCAWGTFQRPSNPVLRDVTERIVIASKGRFDRALSPADRARRGLPSVATVSRDEFLQATTDLWEIPPESATRVGHPAPFPVELPQRLIELYTYEGDTVLDPFVGSGSTAVAALRTHRHYLGYDTDRTYVRKAKERLRDERRRLERTDPHAAGVRLPAEGHPRDAPSRRQARARTTSGPRKAARAPTLGAGVERAVREGRQAKEVARALLEDCGFVGVRSAVKPPGSGIELTFVATDQAGCDWAFDVSGVFTTGRNGLRRADMLWKALATAAVLRQGPEPPLLVLLTTDLPSRGSAGWSSLQAMVGPGRPVFDVVELLDPRAQARLRSYASGSLPD